MSEKVRKGGVERVVVSTGRDWRRLGRIEMNCGRIGGVRLNVRGVGRVEEIGTGTRL